MTNKKESSIDWYISEIESIKTKLIRGEITLFQVNQLESQAKLKAKQMHREEIEQAFRSGWTSGGLISPKEYSNTFKD